MRHPKAFWENQAHQNRLNPCNQAQTHTFRRVHSGMIGLDRKARLLRQEISDARPGPYAGFREIKDPKSSWWLSPTPFAIAMITISNEPPPTQCSWATWYACNWDFKAFNSARSCASTEDIFTAWYPQFDPCTLAQECLCWSVLNPSTCRCVRITWKH